MKAEIPIKPTKKGARLDLAVYVYPDGHGNITGGKGSGANSPVGNEDEAVAVFRQLWRKAQGR